MGTQYHLLKYSPMFFKRKPKVSLEDFCSNHYERHILANIHHYDHPGSMMEIFHRSSFDELVKADRSFQSVKFKTYSDELLKIKFELFSLAWYHKFGAESSSLQEKHSKKYLTDHDLHNVWKDNASYNSAISDSVYHFPNPTFLSQEKYCEYIAAKRFEQINKLASQDVELDIAARVGKRFGTDKKWERLTLTFGHIIEKLNEKIDYRINSDGSRYLQAVLKISYEGITEELKKVKIIIE